MKGPKDPGTIEITEFTPPRRRGRPCATNPKSAAERMAESRRRRKNTGDGERRLDLWISVEAFLALDRLAAHLPDIGKKSILEQLINEYDNRLIKGMTDDQFDAYLNRNRLQQINS